MIQKYKQCHQHNKKLNKKVDAYRNITSSIATVMRYHSIIYRCFSSWKQYSFETKINRAGTWPELWRLSKLTPDRNKQFGDIMHESHDMQHLQSKDKSKDNMGEQSHSEDYYKSRFVHPDDSKSVLTSSSISSVSSPQMLLHQYSKGTLQSHYGSQDRLEEGGGGLSTSTVSDLDKSGQQNDSQYSASVHSATGIAKRLKQEQRNRRRGTHADHEQNRDEEESQPSQPSPLGRPLQHQMREDQLQNQTNRRHQQQQQQADRRRGSPRNKEQAERERARDPPGRPGSSSSSSSSGGSHSSRRRRQERSRGSAGGGGGGAGRKGITLQELLLPGAGAGAGAVRQQQGSTRRQSPRNPSASAPAAVGQFDFLDGAIEDDIDFDDYYDTQQQYEDDDEDYEEEYEDDEEAYEEERREGNRHNDLLDGLDIDAEDQLSEALDMDLEGGVGGSYGTQRSQLTSTGGSYSEGSLAFSGEQSYCGFCLCFSLSQCVIVSAFAYRSSVVSLCVTVSCQSVSLCVSPYLTLCHHFTIDLIAFSLFN